MRCKPYPIAIASVFFISLAGCKKEDDRQYSYWNVNNESFSSNDMRVDKGKARCEFTTNNHREGFQIVFNLNYFPSSGSFSLGCISQDPNCICIDILHRDTGYLPNTPATNWISAKLSNGKGQYILPQTWFHNSYRPTEDSILVSGTFNEP